MTQDRNEIRIGGCLFIERRARARGVEFRIVEGPDAGSTLILLPGMLNLWNDYQRVLPALAARFHVVAMDLRGHGGSEWAADGRYRVVDYSDDVIALIESEHRSPVAISGNSLGGLIALDVAARRPELVRAIAIEDAPLLITEPQRWASHWYYPFFGAVAAMLTEWRSRGADVPDLERRIATLDLYRPPIDKSRADRMISSGKILERLRRGGLLSGDEARRIAAGWTYYVSGQRPRLGDCLPGIAIQTLAAAWATVDPRVPVPTVDLTFSEGLDHLAALRAVRCPVLLWEADFDMSGLVPQPDIERVLHSLSHVPHRHERVDGAGHQIHAEAPERFAARTIEFFSQG